MSKIRNKLRNNSGMSLLFAMLAFLVASSVSISIILASTSSFMRVHNDRKEQQSRLNLISAAKLLVEEFEDTKISVYNLSTYQYETRQTVGISIPVISVEEHIVDSYEETEYSGPLANEIRYLIDNKGSIQRDLLTIELKNSDEINPVSVDMKMDFDDVITVTLKDTVTNQNLFVRISKDTAPLTSDELRELQTVKDDPQYRLIYDDSPLHLHLAFITKRYEKTKLDDVTIYKWGKLKSEISEIK